jgi:hypothetical protein
LQTPDGRGVYVVGPRYIRLCLASRESCNRFLPLMGRQLGGLMTNEAIDQAFYLATALLAALGIGLAISLWWV